VSAWTASNAVLTMPRAARSLSRASAAEAPRSGGRRRRWVQRLGGGDSQRFLQRARGRPRRVPGAGAEVRQEVGKELLCAGAAEADEPAATGRARDGAADDRVKAVAFRTPWRTWGVRR
jgi:hypothetical protein